MKKGSYIALVTVGCMLLSVGCGKNEHVEQTEAEQKLEVQRVEVSENAIKEAERDTAPQVIFEPGKTLDWYDDETGKWLLHAEYTDVSVTGEGYEAAAEGVRKWMEEEETSVQKSGEQYAEWAKDDEAVPYADDDYYRYSIFQEMELARADSRVISMVRMWSEYTGGAHGNYWYEGVVFDAVTGEKLDLSHVLQDAGGFRQKATGYIVKKLQEQYDEGLFPDYEQTVEDMWATEPAWYLDAAGITFIFNPYAVGPYAMGEARVTLPYGEFDSYLKEEYRKPPSSGDGTGSLAANTDIPVDLPLSSFGENVLRLQVEELDEYGTASISLLVNGNSAEVGEFARLGDAWLIRMEGESFVLLDADYASDDYVTMVYRITTGVPQQTDRLEGVSLGCGNINTEKLTLNMHLDVFGTYGGWMDYTLGTDGKLRQQEEFFRISQDDSPYRGLTVIRELPVLVDGQEETLPEGSCICITATDNQGVALFREKDTGLEGQILYTRGKGDDSWGLYVDGVSEYEYFENLPYAG